MPPEQERDGKTCDAHEVWTIVTGNSDRAVAVVLSPRHGHETPLSVANILLTTRRHHRCVHGHVNAGIIHRAVDLTIHNTAELGGLHIRLGA